MGSDTKPSSSHGPLVLLLSAILLGAAGIAAGMWLQSERDTNPEGVQLSSADIGFAQDMSVHHEQAVLIAQTLSRDIDPQIRVIADQIVVAQTSEIATMRGWLNLFDEPFTTPRPMQWMHGSDPAMSDHGGAPMPGAASTSEITRLAGLRGADAETLFLQLMIRHHQGGVDMAEAATHSVASEPIRRIARGMIRDQSNEIAVMTAILDTRDATPLPHP
ncbi:hypothetical protein OPAG_04928 [Rhodococcus opacus PD630]|uniref:DUF305 domain-containing protein n=1 Tax=Rhodococcus TaxID=1827 RepID=UPI00029CB5A6|nr:MULTISPECIES: DUF305 domain-containing protein [Rhodococcus]KXF49197.1 DUF305 domain-containing protein [Rhodococcus sp. SC4]RZK69564.1 MAG: DUF305 domain-containing protein [Rhodococcus sp. (in: high G+C Gram-positive bacteria)]EHI44899.1 hypothetical protein OPAG_04928 [Rhodococcus opacus PD630]PBC53765.1 DUF305 domain-containing protein [Rhodococcus sp. ACPA1]UDG94130.1 DUF305 domain-containing protein [Rhodococcus opacus PD630]